MCPTRVIRGLFLKQVIESAPRVGRLDGGCLRAAATRVSRFPFDGSAGHEKFAVVPKILFGNACGDWLRALELSSRIEMAAILTRTKISFALRTLALECNVYRWGDNRSA
jgi:hypothetical protein